MRNEGIFGLVWFHGPASPAVVDRSSAQGGAIRSAVDGEEER
jgi:hypothetical protein